MSSKYVNVLNLGRMGYLKALNVQNALAKQLKSTSNSECGTVILVEHNPVYTIGIRTKDYSIGDECKLVELGAEFHKTNRGGLITFHGPGQLVAYPVLNLKHFTPSLRWYVATIELTVIELCRRYGLTATTSADTGVWIGSKKICAIGVHGSRFVTTHGLALNCNTDLSWFQHIVPCGIVGKGVTSLSEQLNANVSVESVTADFLVCFSELFRCDIIQKPISSVLDEKDIVPKSAI